MQTSSFQLNTPTTHEFGTQCEIKTHCVDAGTQTETFADPVPLKVEFQSQAPEVYSVPANVHAVLKDHPYSKRERITSSTPKKPKGGSSFKMDYSYLSDDISRSLSFYDQTDDKDYPGTMA